ncbi:hypothetical protein ACIP9X_00445 [Arthrobacter sp. NPDC093125]|uniref:hypothetical protein n=1 Tax=Arthrobacter sp. NPDC093125 TaxID=3363944 RepID=UPI0037FB117D
MLAFRAEALQRLTAAPVAFGVDGTVPLGAEDGASAGAGGAEAVSGEEADGGTEVAGSAGLTLGLLLPGAVLVAGCGPACSVGPQAVSRSTAAAAAALAVNRMGMR